MLDRQSGNAPRTNPHYLANTLLMLIQEKCDFSFPCLLRHFGTCFEVCLLHSFQQCSMNHIERELRVYPGSYANSFVIRPSFEADFVEPTRVRRSVRIGNIFE